MLPTSANRYLIEPLTEFNLSIGRVGSLIRGIVDRDIILLLYANFGEQPICIRKGQKMGLLSPCEGIRPESYEVFINLADVFQGLPPVSDETTDKRPPGYPYLEAPPPEEAPGISRADISDQWGKEYQQKIRANLSANSEPFRKELGCFNDGMHMPIPFRPNVDITDLRQSPKLVQKRPE